ncbi:MAG: hypothetical protein COA95_04980 [Methylophaga sp.]|nr:MAG: hypothetical protein COA95_04980 [Methylophaga sp.]
MKTVSTNTFKIQVFDDFSSEQKQYETFSIWNINETYRLQFPIINMAISLITDLNDEFEGESYPEKVYNYFNTKRLDVEVIEKKTIIINGKTAYFLSAKSTLTRSNKTVDVFNIFVNIPIDDVYMQEFSSDCEMLVKETYEPLFLEAIESIEWFGDIKKQINIQEKAYKEKYERLDALLAKTEVLSSGKDMNIENDDEGLKEFLANVEPFNIPKGNQNICEIGNWKFQFDEKESYINVTEFSKEFVVNLVARTDEYNVAEKANLLSEYPGEGEIKLSFGVKNVYQNGAPTAALKFEEDKCKTPYINLTTDGFEYSLDFFGIVTIQQGWVAYNGFLKPPYSEKPVFPVKIYKKFNPEKINWQYYNFAFAEALQVDPKIVQHLYVKKNEITVFPKEILTFKNLIHLSFSEIHPFNNEEKHLLITEIPEEIGDLNKLKGLYIQNTNITSFPESIGKLTKLEHLNLSGNKLEKLPKNLLKLPNLELCWVSGNNIKEIESDINVPKLRSIDLSSNKLKTLPKSLALQVALDSIHLDENPLENLPDEYNQVKVIELKIEDKRRLLDFDYKGADEKGVIEWNDAMYFAKHDTELNQRLLDATKEGVLNKYRNAFQKIGLKSVGMSISESDDYSTIGNTRFGGLPDLPKGIDYPGWNYEYDEEKEYCHYQFIAQLNCAELASVQDYLPRTGILYFFITDQEGFKAKIIYTSENTSLISAKEIDKASLNIFDDAGIFKPFKVEISNFVGIPHFYSDELWQKVYDLPELEQLEECDSEDNEAFNQVNDDFRKQLGKKGKTIEWTNTFHPDWQHSINDYVFTQNESPQEQAALNFKGNPEGFVVLLKVNSDNKHDCGFCFWDAGELFFVIHKSDLAKKDFSNVFCTIESS